MDDFDDEWGRELLARVKENRIAFIQLQFTDLHGFSKNVTIPVSKLNEALTKGVWFDGSSIEGFTRICESDMYLKPDPRTYAVLPWEDHETATARIICDVYTPEGYPFPGDPRHVLKKAIKKAENMGFRYLVGPELEFFLFKKTQAGEVLPVTNDQAGYFDFTPRDSADAVRKRIIFALESLGLDVEMSHHEVAPGQHEIDFKYDDALTQADRCMTFKQVVKCVANHYGLHASFMPKPAYGKNGSGMHVHQSLFDITTGMNVFFDDNDAYKLSARARSFIAGQLVHAKGFCAITAPTVNSYKRLVPGYEAPVYICWASRNRSALIRIPRYSPGREEATRCEIRCPDPSCNPYLAFAVILSAGLHGIEQNMTPPEPLEEDVFAFDEIQRKEHHIETLPGSLEQAVHELENDFVIREALGTHTVSAYLRGKKQEWDAYRQQVTQWEIDTYFERL